MLSVTTTYAKRSCICSEEPVFFQITGTSSGITITVAQPIFLTVKIPVTILSNIRTIEDGE